MIHFFSVGKFVYHNIIQDFFRGEDQPPVEVQVSFAGAASPAGFLFPDRDTAVGYAHFSGVGCGFSFEYFWRIPYNNCGGIPKEAGFLSGAVPAWRRRGRGASGSSFLSVRENDGWWNLALCVERGQLPDRKR